MGSLHKNGVLHHDIKPQNVTFQSRDRSLETDRVTEKEDQVSLIDLGMSYFAPETTTSSGAPVRPKRGCRFCGSMDYSSKGSRYRCQPSRRDDLESLGYLLLWLSMGNRAFKAWRSTILEPYWEMLSVLYEDKADIADVLSCPSNNEVPYETSLRRQDDPTRVFIRRSAVQQKPGPNGKTANKEADKRCDMTLFHPHSSRPDDIIEGNFPKLNRDKVPEKLLFFLLYAQTLQFGEVPNYAALRKMFSTQEMKRIGSVASPGWAPTGPNGEYMTLTVKQSNAMGVPDWLRARLDSHCCVPRECRSSNPSHIPEKVPSSDTLYQRARALRLAHQQQQQQQVNAALQGAQDGATWASPAAKSTAMLGGNRNNGGHLVGQQDMIVHDAVSPLDSEPKKVSYKGTATRPGSRQA